MECPNCRAAMHRRREGVYADIPIEACEGCGSIFLDPEALDRLDDNIFVAISQIDWVAPTAPTEEHGCPRCVSLSRYRGGEQVRMQAVLPRGRDAPLIHRCPRCTGHLLGPGQLEAVRDLAAVL